MNHCFKKKRVAHVSKDVEAPKKKRLNFTLAEDVNKELQDLADSTANYSGRLILKKDLSLKSAGAIIAAGEVSNEHVTETVDVEDEAQSSEFVHPGDGLKFRVKLENIPFHNLRRRSKPNQLNEDVAFMKNIRNAVKFNEELKRRSSKKKKDDVGDDDGSLGQPVSRYGQRISKVGLNNWTYSTPAPKELIEIHTEIYCPQKGDEVNMNDAPVIKCRSNGVLVDWDEYLQSGAENLERLPDVTDFKWAPFVEIWDEIAVLGLRVELPNPYLPQTLSDTYWVGTIIHFAGYQALVKFETFDLSTSERSCMAWFSFCSDIPKPLGWCKINGKELKPGPIIKDGHRHDYEPLLKEFSTGLTIAWNHSERLRKIIQELQRTWNPSLPLEVLDLRSFHQNRLARVNAVIGNLVSVRYYTIKGDDSGYEDGAWFHSSSDQIHPLFWSNTVGVDLNGVEKIQQMADYKLPPETFPAWPEDKIDIKEGMVLEVRHPFHAYKIVAALVVKVLKHGYFMFITMESDSFYRMHYVHHVTSPLVLPWGFGEKHGIEVDRDSSLACISTGDPRCLQLELLPPQPPHSFKIGDKLEAFDVGNPDFIGCGTVEKVAGHMLHLYFDGWKRKFANSFQWVDACSDKIYPVGYAELLGIRWGSGTVIT